MAKSLLETAWLEEIPVTADRMPNLLLRYRSDKECLDRSFAIAVSRKRWDRLRLFYREWQARLKDIAFAPLTRADQVDWLLFRALLEMELRRLEWEERRFAAAEHLIPFAASLIALEETRRAMSDIDARETANILHQAHAEIETLIRALDQDTVEISPSDAGCAVQVIEKLRAMLGSWSAFYDGYDPDFTWWASRPYRALDKRLEEYAALVRQKAAGAGPDTILGSPIGRDALTSELRYTLVPYEPEELIHAARSEMEWCRMQLALAAADMGFGQDWRAALDRVKSEHVSPGKQPALVRDLAREAVEYVRSNNLATVPVLAEECWRMEMISPDRQKINPFFLGGEVIGVSYPACEMEYPQKIMSLRGNNRAFARATVHHELIPGHRLQAFFQERCRPYRRVFSTPFWTEGWTLHWEMLLWERGFARTPQEKIGMLFWRQHRCARVIFSLMFHLGQMSARECVEMLVQEAGHEPDNAQAEVRRSLEANYSPLYQAAYLIGGMQVHALYRELVGAGRMSDREFHDSMLQQNCMPIAMLRALLCEYPLDPGSLPDWRFLSSLPERDHAGNKLEMNEPLTPISIQSK